MLQLYHLESVGETDGGLDVSPPEAVSDTTGDKVG